MSLWPAGCSMKEQAANNPGQEVVLLISIDGFRHDYIDLTETPAFDRLMSDGVRASSLIPVFPSKTFPNHYSIVTGLYPEHHGIVANTMVDTVFGETFRIGAGSPTAQDGKWYGGEPVWVTAETQGKTAATFFWPGSDAEINGVRPTHYRVFDNSIAYEDRVDQVLSWLAMPSGQRPDFISLYFESVDSRGHEQGPASPGTLAEVRNIDRHLGDLLDGIAAAGLSDRVNVLVVSDHGMAQLSRDRVIFLDDYIDPDQDADIVNWSPVTDFIPARGTDSTFVAALRGAHPHYEVYAKSEIPDDLHYRDHYRISPVIGIADEGWSVTTRSYFDSHPEAFQGGNHGYKPGHQSMHGIFVASGPSFARGLTTPSLQAVDIYALMCHILAL
ncbi:MAG: ectonucleotide pyrophosphatase/phosphodiesterase, partial [Saprospiraceae bacterium]|nr:ectonucleotide pyrophosphatase/phosphodiesterase [Saprospiraceae bacterium]